MSEVTEQIPEYIAAIAGSAPPSAPELIEFCYQRLAEEGIKPEYKKIREKISRIRPDGKGPSYTAMSPVVKALKLKERASAQVVVAEMPVQLSELLGRIGDNFWRSATDLAGEKVEVVQKAAEKRVQEAEEETAQFQEENQRLDRDLDALKEALAKISREKEELSARLQGSQEEKARLEGERGGLLSDKERLEKALEDDKERLEAALKEAKWQNMKTLEQLEAEKKRSESLKSELAGVKEDFTLLKMENQKLVARAEDRDKVASEREKLAGEISGMKAELKAVSMQEKRITGEFTTLRGRQEKTLLELGQWKEKHRQLEKISGNKSGNK